MDEESDTYDNINELMSNIENKEMLTYKLIYLSVVEPKVYQTFCDYCGIKLVNNQIVSTSDSFKSLQDVAANSGYSITTVKKHIKIASNILKYSSIKLGKLIFQQEDYVVALLKGLFLLRSMTYDNKKNYFFNIIDLFAGKLYDERIIQYIRTILSETNDDNLLQYKDIIERKLQEIEQKHTIINDGDIANDSDQLGDIGGKHL